MSELSELREVLGATRSQVKAARNVLRNCLPLLTDLEERLDALEAESHSPRRHSANGTITHEPDRAAV